MITINFLEEILANFDRFGPACIDWPNKRFFENVPPAGYAFIIFGNPQSVNHLMDTCSYIDYKHVIGIRTLDGTKRLVGIFMLYWVVIILLYLKKCILFLGGS